MIRTLYKLLAIAGLISAARRGRRRSHAGRFCGRRIGSWPGYC